MVRPDAVMRIGEQRHFNITIDYACRSKWLKAWVCLALVHDLMRLSIALEIVSAIENSRSELNCIDDVRPKLSCYLSVGLFYLSFLRQRALFQG